ncbi:hypothetical protein LguiB_013015 [Lonicera macranthoides]
MASLRFNDWMSKCKAQFNTYGTDVPVEFVERVDEWTWLMAHWNENKRPKKCDDSRPNKNEQMKNNDERWKIWKLDSGYFLEGVLPVARVLPANSHNQMFHIDIYACRNAKLQGTKIMAAGNSPNTDGIHVQLSTGVSILNSQISTGDDCISIGPRNSNLWIENIACGLGHGISIGSLGWDLQEPGVQNVTVKTVTFKGTQNGNPIIIDQNYCPNNKNCPGQVSGIKISDIMYQDIHGTSATAVAVNFDCSKKYPCSNIKLVDVNLSYKDQTAQASCSNVGGTSSGVVKPSSCL